MEFFFLPESLVKLVLKIAKRYSIDNFSLFSLLDTLEYALNKNYLKYKSGGSELQSEKDVAILIVNIIRLSEKFNNMKSSLIKYDKALELAKDTINSKEFEAFKSFDFKVRDPVIADEIFKMINTHLDSERDLLEMSLEVLKMFYCWRVKMFNELSNSTGSMEVSKKLLSDKKAVAASIILVALKLRNTSEKMYNATFDVICEELYDLTAKEINNLSGIFFSYINNDV